MKLAFRFITLFYLILILPITTRAQDNYPEKLIGVWQDSPSLGSGWSSNFQFFEDGRFNYNHNQMNCTDSVITESGYYHYEDGILYLDYDSITYISGGQLIPSTGSCASEYEISGGEITVIAHEHSEGRIIETVNRLEAYDYIDRILIDGESWFHLLQDPNDY
jgi:hypothetical protein